MGVVDGQNLKNQPLPRAVAVEDLLPKFSKEERVVSSSKQFTVGGGEAAVRGTAVNVAEETKQELLALTGEKEDGWKVPIQIELRGKVGDAVPLRTTVLDLLRGENGYVLKIFVNLSRGFQPEEFKRIVTAGLIYARGLEGGEVSTDVPLVVPPWLVEGLREATAWRLKQTDRRLYDALFRYGGLYKLEDLFMVSEGEYGTIDAVSKAAFRVSSGALMMALLEQPEGKAVIRDFLKELPGFRGEMPSLLRKHFPELNLSATSLAKWWALQLADKGTAPLTESLSLATTDKGLTDALKIRHRDVEGALRETPIAGWRGIGTLAEGERVVAVARAQDDLLRLSYRCFPSFRPLLLEYQMLLLSFAKGEMESLDGSITALQATRTTMLEKAERARDFLDWFEITRAREVSGVFEDYLSLKARLKANRNERVDDVSRYLDRLEPLFELPQERGVGGPRNAEFRD